MDMPPRAAREEKVEMWRVGMKEGVSGGDEERS